MSLHQILNARPLALATYNKFISDNPLSTNYHQPKLNMIQRLPMSTHAIVNSISDSNDNAHVFLTRSVEIWDVRLLILDR